MITLWDRLAAYTCDEDLLLLSEGFATYLIEVIFNSVEVWLSLYPPK